MQSWLRSFLEASIIIRQQSRFCGQKGYYYEWHIIPKPSFISGRKATWREEERLWVGREEWKELSLVRYFCQYRLQHPLVSLLRYYLVVTPTAGTLMWRWWQQPLRWRTWRLLLSFGRNSNIHLFVRFSFITYFNKSKKRKKNSTMEERVGKVVKYNLWCRIDIFSSYSTPSAKIKKKN